ncbi:MAG: hypothetical protein KDA78_03240 [Planctomycetaceae bacterium]|nr:hypothetical protein [Planctomycetaceae bacterium]
MRYEDGSKQLVNCFVNRKLVGTRVYDEDGYLCLESPLKDGQLHGIKYTWYFDGILTSAEPFLNGKAHGVSKQWSPSGELIGKYTMTQGTGVDLWWHSVNGSGEAPFYLSEVHCMQDGLPHGYAWWINEDQKTVEVERHFDEGIRHGIFREWNHHGRLGRGFPQYFIKGTKVRKHQYIHFSTKDKSLPVFHDQDNLPNRIFPVEIRQHLLKQN